MALTGKYNTNSIENVQITDSGKQRVVLSVPVNGTIESVNMKEPTVLVDDGNGNKQLALAVVNFGTVSESSLESVNGETGAVVLEGSDIESIVGGSIDTVENHLNTIKADLGDIGDDLTELRNDIISKTKTDEQVLRSPLNVKDELSITDGSGNEMQLAIIGGVATIATNNGLDIISDTTFDSNPTVVGQTNFDLMPNGNLVTKGQLQSVLSEITGTHFEKWMASGKPEDLTLTESLQKLYIPATTRYPNVPPADIEPTSDGKGIIFKKAGLVHVKRNVSLGGSNTENLYYEARINDQRLEPLLMQAVSVSENTMNYSIEFYWYVSANQEFSIWANCLNNDCTLNYKGVTTFIEYL